jgi:hypothetical protein
MAQHGSQLERKVIELLGAYITMEQGAEKRQKFDGQSHQAKTSQYVLVRIAATIFSKRMNQILL